MVSQFNNNIIYLSAHSEYTGPWESNNPNNLDINYEWVINRFIWLAQSVEHWTRNPKAVGSIFTSDRCDSLHIHSKLSLEVLGSILIWTNVQNWRASSFVKHFMVSQFNENDIYLPAYSGHNGSWWSNNPNNLDINFEVMNRIAWLAQLVEHCTYNP